MYVFAYKYVLQIKNILHMNNYKRYNSNDWHVLSTSQLWAKEKILTNTHDLLKNYVYILLYKN